MHITLHRARDIFRPIIKFVYIVYTHYNVCKHFFFLSILKVDNFLRYICIRALFTSIIITKNNNKSNFLL